MKRNLLFIFVLSVLTSSFAQTKVSGHVFDEFNEAVPYANIIFKNSSEGTTTNENGRFYLESDQTWEMLIVSFIGYETLEIPLEKKVNFDLKFILKEEASTLDEVVIVRGRQPKKNNPAIDILRKIWEYKRTNGLKKVNH